MELRNTCEVCIHFSQKFYIVFRVVIQVKYLQQIVGHCYSYLLSQSENHLRFVLKMTVDRISHSALHARFKVKRNKGRPRLRRIDNMNEDIESVGPTLR